METETDNYIRWKQEYFDQDVIKRYSSYTCHTPATPHPSAIFSSLFIRLCFYIWKNLGFCCSLFIDYSFTFLSWVAAGANKKKNMIRAKK